MNVFRNLPYHCGSVSLRSLKSFFKMGLPVFVWLFTALLLFAQSDCSYAYLGSQPQSCIDMCDGTQSFEVINGTAPFTFDPYQGFMLTETTFIIIGFCSGEETFTIVDANGCEKNIGVYTALLDQNCEISGPANGQDCIIGECSKGHLPTCNGDINYHNFCHALCLGVESTPGECFINSSLVENCPGIGIQIGNPPVNEDATFFWTPNYGLSCFDCPFPIADPIVADSKTFTRREYIEDGGFSPSWEYGSDTNTGTTTGSSTGTSADTSTDTGGFPPGTGGFEQTTNIVGSYYASEVTVTSKWACSDGGSIALIDTVRMCVGQSNVQYDRPTSTMGSPVLAHPPLHGTLENFLYTPPADFIGIDTFYMIWSTFTNTEFFHVYVDVNACDGDEFCFRGDCDVKQNYTLEYCPDDGPLEYQLPNAEEIGLFDAVSAGIGFKLLADPDGTFADPVDVDGLTLPIDENTLFGEYVLFGHCLNDFDNCGEAFVSLTVVENCDTGVSDNLDSKSKSIKVLYGNTLDVWIEVDKEIGKSFTYSIYDLKGKLIQENQTDATSFQLSTEHLPAGTYLIQTPYGSERFVLR